MQFEELIGRSLDDVYPLEGRLKACRRDLEQQSTRAATLVAESGGEVVGTASWHRVSADLGEVEDLDVTPDAWGTGVAPQLLDTAVLALRGAGAKTALLWVGEANARARRFYEREGWEHDGTSRPSQLGPVELRYRLGPSSPSSPA